MKILFSGGSSFTGFWFIQELAARGHEVIAPLFGNLGEYRGVRGRRVDQLLHHAEIIEQVPFGSDRFFDLIEREAPFDLYCHHAAWVRDYRSDRFDLLFALKNNTYRVQETLKRLKRAGVNHLLLTGSVFEKGEGNSDSSDLPFSPYGLSKGLTSEIFNYYCSKEEIVFGKFVIGNPIGPYEEERMTHYLIDNWMRGRVPQIKNPHVIRDNIFVQLLAKHYGEFTEKLSFQNQSIKTAPSGWIESQGDFALRFAREMEKRIRIECPVEMKRNPLSEEPLKRVNSDPIDVKLLDFSESEAWDQIANYYVEKMEDLHV